MQLKSIDYKGHNSLAEMIVNHIPHWREALTDAKMIAGDPDDVLFIDHELKALAEIEEVCKLRLKDAT